MSTTYDHLETGEGPIHVSLGGVTPEGEQHYPVKGDSYFADGDEETMWFLCEFPDCDLTLTAEEVAAWG
jgi:hypothetical protein